MQKSSDDFEIEFLIFLLQSLSMETISEQFDSHLGVSTYPVPISSRSFARIVHRSLEKLINKDKCTANPKHIGHNSRKKAFPFTHFLAPVCLYIFSFFQSLLIFFCKHSSERPLIGSFTIFIIYYTTFVLFLQSLFPFISESRLHPLVSLKYMTLTPTI